MTGRKENIYIYMYAQAFLSYEKLQFQTVFTKLKNDKTFHRPLAKNERVSDDSLPCLKYIYQCLITSLNIFPDCKTSSKLNPDAPCFVIELASCKCPGTHWIRLTS